MGKHGGARQGAGRPKKTDIAKGEVVAQKLQKVVLMCLLAEQIVLSYQAASLKLLSHEEKINGR